MMAQTLAHPLLSLPDDEIIRKLEDMSLEEMLKFSLISGRCKELVTSVQTKAISIHVSIARCIYVYVETDSDNMRLSFYTESDMYWRMGAYGRKKKLTAPQSVILNESGRTYTQNTMFTWEKNELTMIYWLKHLQDVFNCHEIDYIRFSEDSSQFDIDDIKEVFGTAAKVIIKNTGCYVFNQMILELFPVKNLDIKPSNFQNSKIPGKILMQNVDYLGIDNGLEEPTSMTLDELLLINGKIIAVHNPDISPKQLNKFIKLWQKGSNPHMELLHIGSTNFTEDDLEIIMKGIKHKVVPDGHYREFKSIGFNDPDFIDGGYDFYRIDGVKATIQIEYEFRSYNFKMCVWFDYCVVEP